MKRYSWICIGDVNAFFGLMLDNVVNLVVLSAILVGVFNYPQDFIFTKMIPGSAFGVLFGDLVYTYLAIKLQKTQGREDVTAMPLGLDTPSTIGIAFAVLGPTYIETKDPVLTWQVGMATMVFMGIVKVIASFLGDFIRRSFPKAALLGSIGGIGLTLLAFFPLIKIFSAPAVGFVALGLILYTLIGKLNLPFNFPGAFAAVLGGTIIYYALGLSNIGGIEFQPPQFKFYFALPIPTLDFIEGIPRAINYLPLSIPFGILTIIGGINVTESAQEAGDKYKTKDILLTEAIATLVAGFCGGVAQTTPYIGHPAYKKMGGRAFYTFACGLFIGLGGILGYISFIINLLPEGAVTPILLFVGIEIVVQSFEATQKKHFPAVAISYLPIVAYLLLIQLKPIFGEITQRGVSISSDSLKNFQIILYLGNGFILTSMLWGAITAFIIDGERRKAGFYSTIGAILSIFGFIHSTSINSELYLPTKSPSPYNYYIAVGYIIFAIIFFILELFEKKK